MPPEIVLVQYPGLTRETTLSPPCGKVHMTLRLKGLDYKIKNVRTPGQVKRYNPRGRVPALLIDGETLVDSTDIVSELDRRFPDPPLVPDEPAERALVKILEDWADEVLYFYGLYIRWVVPAGFERMRSRVLSRMPAPMRWVVPGIARRVTRQRASAQGVELKGEEVARREIRECYRAIADLMGSQPFLVGNRITRADLSVAATLDQHRLQELTPELAADINGIPALVAWLERVHRLAPSAA